MNLTSLTLAEQKHIASKVKEVADSDGWKFLQNIMAAEREEFMRKVCAPTAPVSKEAYEYNRGIMEGTYRLHDLPTKVLTELRSSIKLAEATIAATMPPATPT